MIGANELTLNEETMCQAVQEWLTKRFPENTPRVVSVKPAPQVGGYSSSSGVKFSVVLESKGDGS